MHIHEIDAERADALERDLTEVRRLEGTYRLEEWTTDRYHLIANIDRVPGFTALTGDAAEFGSITLLRSQDRCVVMVGATVRPFV